MSQRRKNLLEAFKRSDAPGAPPAGSLSASDAPAERPTLFEATAVRSASRRQPAWALAAIGLVLAFVLGFALGRNTGRAARAEESGEPGVASEPRPSPPRSFQERPTAAGESAPGETEKIEESPLFDARNAYTVVVATYSSSNQDPAWATYELLRDAKLAVFPPVASRNLVVVLVGAAPTSAELERTRDAVRALEKNGKKLYPDAYCARIDTLVPRSTPKGTESR